MAILILLFLAGEMAAQVPVLDSVCYGALRYYRVDGEAGSTYSWIITPPAGTPDTLLSSADTVEVLWDYPTGIYELQAIQHGANGCDAEAVYGLVYVLDAPEVYAGPDDLVCIGYYYKILGSTAAHTGSLQWVTSGDGTFDNDTTLHPSYNPGPEDILAGSVTLTLTGFGQGFGDACEPSQSSLQLFIVDEIVPLFDSIGPLCQKSIPPPLPDTSLNGMAGNWDPPVIQTDLLGTFPYTFTPLDIYHCGVDTTILITIVEEIEPTFDPIGPLCINSVPPALPDTSLEGITGTWEPDTINTSVQGQFTYTFTPNDTTQCGIVTSILIGIETEIAPLFDPIGPLCQNTPPPELPVTSLNGITGTWAPQLISTTDPGTFLYMFTPDPGECGLDTTMQITILPHVVAVFEPIDTLCQYSVAPALPGTSLNGVSGTWNPPFISTALPGTFTFVSGDIHLRLYALSG